METVHLSKGQKLNRLKERMQSLLQNGEKRTPKQWKAEIQSLKADYDSIGKEQTNDRKLRQELSLELAYAEVISYNRKISRGSFRMRADNRTGNKAGRSGERKKFNVKFIVKTDIFLYN